MSILNNIGNLTRRCSNLLRNNLRNLEPPRTKLKKYRKLWGNSKEQYFLSNVWKL